jgi:hypothetical protein
MLKHVSKHVDAKTCKWKCRSKICCLNSSGSSKASTHGGNMKKHMFSHSRSLTITAIKNNNKTNNNKQKQNEKLLRDLNSLKNSLSYANCVGYFYKYITASLDELYSSICNRFFQFVLTLFKTTLHSELNCLSWQTEFTDRKPFRK